MALQALPSKSAELDSGFTFFDDDDAVGSVRKTAEQRKGQIFVFIMTVNGRHHSYFHRFVGRNPNSVITIRIYNFPAEGGLNDGDIGKKFVGIKGMADIIAVSDAEHIGLALAHADHHR